jgi:hypothetical protein
MYDDIPEERLYHNIFASQSVCQSNWESPSGRKVLAVIKSMYQKLKNQICFLCGPFTYIHTFLGNRHFCPTLY